MSRGVESFEGMLLRQQEIDMLQRARRGAPWPGSAIVPIIERLGRARAAYAREEPLPTDKLASAEQGAERLQRQVNHLRLLLDDARAKRERDLAKAEEAHRQDREELIAEIIRVGEERDDARAALNNETARRLRVTRMHEEGAA